MSFCPHDHGSHFEPRFPQVCVVLRNTAARIHATIARFYMTTNTTQSAATPARRETYTLNLSFDSRSRTTVRRSRAADFLIANARLKFDVSHSKQNLLKIPNRERIAIFSSAFSPADTKRAGGYKPSAEGTTSPPRAVFQLPTSSLQPPEPNRKSGIRIATNL
jgi:hypothetical protein